MLARRTFAVSPLTGLHRGLDQLLARFAAGFDLDATERTRTFPALNVWEDGDCFYAEAEVPGFSMDQLEILVAGNELTIKGQRDFTTDEERVYHCRQRGVSEFTRYTMLPAEVDADKVEAALKDGVLNIQLPKAEAARARKIAVKAR
ncbi:MAG: Hsp20/alpha crystallin family protein [Planctomycetes bacterium]|nr:Hsp20/alpha crystallin family protein [Planctomycetota bacterium]